jgi:RNA polymerase sigma-70 factor (ECF subfamily)
LLEDQDRTLWDRRAIDEGRALLEKALALHQAPGPFQVQAAIAALHAEAARFDETDWPQIEALYDHMVKLTDSDVVRVNRAVAVGMARSPDEGLAALDVIGTSDELARYQPYHAARAGLLFRAGKAADALDAYRVALAGERNGAVRRFFESRIVALERVRATSG